MQGRFCEMGRGKGEKGEEGERGEEGGEGEYFESRPERVCKTKEKRQKKGGKEKESSEWEGDINFKFLLQPRSQSEKNKEQNFLFSFSLFTNSLRFFLLSFSPYFFSNFSLNFWKTCCCISL